MLVRDIMTDVVQIVDATTTLRDALVIFEAGDIRHLPVMRGDKLMGVLSSTDVTGLGKYLRAFSDSSDQNSALGLPVSDFMSADIVTLSRDSTLVAATDLIIHLRVGALPVVDDQTDELVGIVSYVDLLRAARESFEQMSS